MADRGAGPDRIGLEELLSSEARIAGLRDLLARGGIVAIPTETFYGLAANPWSVEGCRRVFAVKGRSAEMALPVLAAGREDLDRLGIVAAPGAAERFFSIWPAPLTVVFAARAPLPCTSGESSVAVRVPAHAALRRLLSRIGPVTGTSANASGEAPVSSPEAVVVALGPAIDLLVDGGPTPGGAPSTIVDARVDPPRVLRAGAFAWPETR